MGGSTMFLSTLFITILHNCLRMRFRTDLSQFSAYMDSEPAQDDSDYDDANDNDDPTVQQIHQRVENVVRGDGDLGLGDGLTLAAAPHLLQQPRHLLDGVVNLGHEAATHHTAVSNLAKMQFADQICP